MVDMVTSQLLTVHEAFNRLDPKQIAQLLSTKVPELGEEIIQDMTLPLIQQHKHSHLWLISWITKLPEAIFLGLPKVSQQILKHFNLRFLERLAKDLISNSESLFDIQNCVQSQMLQDRSLLGQLFRKCGQKELDFLTNSGLWFGFLLGTYIMK